MHFNRTLSLDQYFIKKTFYTRNQSLTRIINSDTTYGLWGASTLSQEQSHMWEKRHIFTQNLKALNIWVLSLIKYSTSNFPNNVRFIIHICISTIFSLTVSPSTMFFLRRKLFHPYILILSLTPLPCHNTSTEHITLPCHFFEPSTFTLLVNCEKKHPYCVKENNYTNEKNIIYLHKN